MAGHEAVIAGAVDHFDVAEVIDKFIKNAGEETADGRFAFAGDAASGDTIILAVLEITEHFRKELGWILEISINYGNVIAIGVPESGEHGGFFAKITRKG